MIREMARALFERRLRHAPEIEQSVNRSAASYLGKQSKLETAVDGIFAQQMHEAAQDEIETQRQYRQRTLGETPTDRKRKKMGDFIVCDDYRKGVSPIVLGIVAVVAIIMAGLALWALLWMAAQRAEPPEYPGPPDTEYEVRFYDRDGNVIHVPHISQREQ